MQKSPMKATAKQEAKKPLLVGSWHGQDAWRRGFRLMAGMMAVMVVYVLLSTMLRFDSLPLRGLLCAVIVALSFLYMYSQGLNGGQGDAAFAEIMYQRDQEGKPVSRLERDRCFHPAKGFWAAFVGALPFLAATLIFALYTKPTLYTLGVLPNWLRGLTRQSEFGAALRYYDGGAGVGALEVLRVFCRALIMPFINVAVMLGDEATLWTERMSPLLILIAPMGYGAGYRNGVKARARIHASIALGDEKKRRKERKERKRRARGNVPERLI